MKSVTRWGLLLAVAVSPTIGAGEAAADDGGAAPPPVAAAQPSPAAEADSDGETDAGPSAALGIAGIAVGAAGIVGGVLLLAAGADQKTEAKDLGAKIQTDMPGSNQCGGSQAHVSCDDLASAANEGALMTTAGYLLFVGGGVLALSGGLYLGIGRHREDASKVSIQIAPVVGPGLWGAAAGGTF